MSKLFITLLLALCCGCLHAQMEYDILYLKDGSIYRGHITEYIPDDHATIKLLDDRIIVVPADQIMRMTVGRDQVIKKNFDIKDKGYFHNSLLGLHFGNSVYLNPSATFAYNMVNGYRIKQHHMGAGLGIENHLTKWYTPIYADYSYHILKGRTSPMVGINGGFMLPLNDKSNSRYSYSRGSFFGGRIGFVAYSNEHFAFLLNITYRYMHLSGAEYTWNPFWNGGHDVSGSARIHRVGLMLGFVIN